MDESLRKVDNDMDENYFTDIEETISFWTRNDFAIANCLLVGNMDDIWEISKVAYNDNKGILKEYDQGVRKINGEYDIKWINSLKTRIIEELDSESKEQILLNAKNDILNIMKAMKPAKSRRLLYRTAWITESQSDKQIYPYAHQYKSLYFGAGDTLEIKIISSTSVTPYREDEVDCDFYRYEISVPINLPILELDQFICHNEAGEVLLPPMKCRVNNIRDIAGQKCKGIIEMEYIEQLPINPDIFHLEMHKN